MCIHSPPARRRRSRRRRRSWAARGAGWTGLVEAGEWGWGRELMQKLVLGETRDEGEAAAALTLTCMRRACGGGLGLGLDASVRAIVSRMCGLFLRGGVGGGAVLLA
jgi:hypothetical protein